MTDHQCDVLVVGAGPAGLATAFAVSTMGDANVLLADAGLDVDKRQRVYNSHGRDDLVTGVGGAGLFSDGKLCLSLAVGGELSLLCSAEERSRLLDSVMRLLQIELPSEPVVNSIGLSGKLEQTTYPVVHLGTDGCNKRIQIVRERITCHGVDLRPEWTLIDIVQMQTADFCATFETPTGRHNVYSPQVVLAMGKTGAARENAFACKLGASSSPLPMYVGVRLEMDAADGKGLFQASDDVKLKLNFTDGTKCKTHCAAAGGAILPLFYEGLPLAGGHAYAARNSGRSSIGILWNGITDRSEGYRMARQLMERNAALTGERRLLVQRLVDYWQGCASFAGAVRSANPTTDLWSAGDLRKLLPFEFFGHFDAFLDELLVIAPQLGSPNTLLYGPAIEWWMNRVATDEGLQTEVPGLFVAGDGAGWSQGIVHAAACGFLVAESIIGRQLRADEFGPDFSNVAV
jgi:uncharacterized protein